MGPPGLECQPCTVSTMWKHLLCSLLWSIILQITYLTSVVILIACGRLMNTDKQPQRHYHKSSLHRDTAIFLWRIPLFMLHLVLHTESNEAAYCRPSVWFLDSVLTFQSLNRAVLSCCSSVSFTLRDDPRCRHKDGKTISPPIQFSYISYRPERQNKHNNASFLP